MVKSKAVHVRSNPVLKIRVPKTAKKPVNFATAQRVWRGDSELMQTGHSKRHSALSAPFSRAPDWRRNMDGDWLIKLGGDSLVMMHNFVPIQRRLTSKDPKSTYTAYIGHVFTALIGINHAQCDVRLIPL